MQKQKKMDKLEKAFQDGYKAGIDAKENDHPYARAFGRLAGYIEMNHTGKEIQCFLKGMDKGMGHKK